jgi:hypothetical protein
MKIAYGPPGIAGVKHLQYVGDDGDADFTSTGLSQLARPVALGALGVAVYGGLTRRKKLLRQGGAVAIAAFLIEILSRK